MARVRLEKRERDLFDFESDLLEQPNTGYARKAGPDLFQLVLNPLFTRSSSNIFYRVSPDIIRLFDPNVPYHIVTNKRELDYKKFYGRTSIVNPDRIIYEVDDVSEYNLKIYNPHIKKDDFLSLITNDWDYAKDDHLDLALALQILSSPKTSSNHSGGIGSLTYYLNENMGDNILRNGLKRTINNCIPFEFGQDNPLCYFGLIENRSETQNLISNYSSGRTSEFSYNAIQPIPLLDLSRTNISPTVPTIIREAKPLKKRDTSFDRDVVEYVVRAHMIQPEIVDPNGSLIEGLTKDVNEHPELVDLGLALDEEDIKRTALSVSRLHFKRKFDEKSMMKDFLTLIKLTCDLNREIQAQYTDENGYYSRSLANLPRDVKIVRNQIISISKKYGRGTTLNELLETLSDNINEKSIIKSLKALEENGLIYRPSNNETIVLL